MKTTSGTCLALGVAAIFASACESGKEASKAEEEKATPATVEPKAKSSADEGMGDMAKMKEGEVQCIGVHECKGQSACRVVGGHACAGQNECKGKG